MNTIVVCYFCGRSFDFRCTTSSSFCSSMCFESYYTLLRELPKVLPYPAKSHCLAVVGYTVNKQQTTNNDIFLLTDECYH